MSRTISSLPLGAKIIFGSYCVENEPIHDVKWIKVNDNDTTFLTEYIEDFRAFDAREPESSLRLRQDYGNNYYPVSNIDQFLNSTEENWYAPRHGVDHPPTKNKTEDNSPYVSHPGFLTYFKKAEIEAIVPTDITVYIPSDDRRRDSYGREFDHEIISRMVFLPSETNISGRSVDGIYEDQQWDYFKEDDSPTSTGVTIEAINNTTSTGGTPDKIDTWYYWLRTPWVRSSYSVRYVNRQGYCDEYRACGGLFGIRPALTINPEVLVTDEPDENGYYHTLISSTEVEDVSEDDFSALLG